MNESKSSGFNAFIEKRLMPVAARLGQFKPLIAIRDGITLAMPLIIIGSIFLILGSFPIQAWTDWVANTSIDNVSIAAIFNKIVNGSFGILGLIGCFGIASSYAEQHHTDGKSAGVIALASFFVVTPSIMSGDKAPLEGMPYGYLGSKGLFIAIIIGLIAGGIFQWFINHNIEIKMPDTVPPAVAKSFSALIPGAVIITLFGAVYALFTWTGLGNIHDLLMHIFAKPFGVLSDTLGGTVLSIVLVSSFWFVGIHGANVVNSVISPLWLMNSDANRVLFKAGHLDLQHGGHIISQGFIDNFVYMGGGGATLGLVLAIGVLVVMKRSSKQLELLAPLTITPGLFNINEPAMFGLPVVLNTTILIPFILAPVINAVTTYFAMKTGIVPLATGALVPWTMPPVISGFLANNSWTGSALQLVNVLLDIAIYFPFLMAVNRQQVREEAGETTTE